MTRRIAFLTLLVAWGHSEATAQVTIAPSEPTAVLATPPPVQNKFGPITITLRPAAEPTPSLKYRLVPERRTLIAGNAVVFYHRANQFLYEKRNQLNNKDKDTPRVPGNSIEEQIVHWNSGPIADIPKDVAKSTLASFDMALKEAELGAKRVSCDWEYDQRTDGISLLLPEIQAMRSLARLIVLRIKVAILEGKTDEAMHWIEVGFVVGRHVGQGPFVIQSLVGVAISSEMAKCLDDLIQAPGTPSLFWTLADRPRPFIDMRAAFEGERYLLEKELPELSDLDNGIWSVDQAQRFSYELQRKLFALVAGEPIPGINGAVPMGMPVVGRQLAIGAMALKVYPDARKALIAQGRAEADVEAMPVIQVAALHTIQEYRRYRDDTYKWTNVPYWQSHNAVEKSFAAGMDDRLSNPLLTLFRTLTPALESARWAGVRLDRQLDALQCIESIRLYAAAHDGKLPQSLDVLTGSPAPLDSATGKPFEYKLDGDTATLTGPAPTESMKNPMYMVRYVLKLAK